MRSLTLVLLLGVSCILAVDEVDANAAAQRCGTTRPAISRDAYWQNRPNDFYELCIANDTEVCADLERRLNAVARTPNVQRDPINSWHFGFNISIDGWNPQPMPPPGFRDMDTVLASRVVLDLNGDGQQEVLYQTRWFLSSQPFVKIVWSDSSPTGEPEIEEDLKRKLDPNGPGLAGDVFPVSLLGAYRAQYGWISTDITESNGRYYVVVFRPWTSDAIPNAEAFVVAMDDARNGRLVCRFESRYRVLRVVPR